MSNPTVLILCTKNSCRSQMAEGILRSLAGDTLEARSAGAAPGDAVHPLAVDVLKEIGIDISDHRPKAAQDFIGQDIETVITVCGNADQACPTFPGLVNRHHWPFYDPSDAPDEGDQRITAFRRVRDEIRAVFQAYLDGRHDAAASTPA